MTKFIYIYIKRNFKKRWKKHSNLYGNKFSISSFVLQLVVLSFYVSN